MKLYMTTLAILFAVNVCCSRTATGEKRHDHRTKAEASTSTSAEAADQIVVYYFHGQHRCATCNKMEAMADQVITTQFEKEIESGRLKWSVINTDRKENEHFKNEFNLYTKALIVTALKNKRRIKWKNCEKIWELVHQPDEFMEYVESEVRAYLGKN